MKRIYFLLPILLVAAFAFYSADWNDSRRASQERAAQAAEAQAREDAAARAAYQARIQEEARAAAAEKTRAAAEKKAAIERDEARFEELEFLIGSASKQRDALSQRLYDETSIFYIEQDRRRRAEQNLERLQGEKTFLEAYIPRSLENQGELDANLDAVEDLGRARQQVLDLAKAQEKGKR